MLPLFCATTGISQLAILVNFPNAVLNATRSILKEDSDVVTLGTFRYRDQSFINKRGRRGGGSVIFFTEGEVLNLTPAPPPPTHTPTKQVEKILIPSDKHFKTSNPPPPPRPPYTQTTLTYDNPILLSGPGEY